MPGRFEPNLPQRSAVRGQIVLPGWKSVRRQQKCQDGRVLLSAQSPRLIGGHRGLHFLEQVAGGLSVPITLEIGALERWGGTAAVQIRTVAGRALFLIQRLSLLRLLRAINTIPDGRRLLGMCRGQEKDKPDCCSHLILF